MEEIIKDLATQSPALLIIVWFVYNNNKEWRKYLTERNSKMETALEKHVEELKSLSKGIDKNAKIMLWHDTITRHGSKGNNVATKQSDDLMKFIEDEQ